MIDILPFYFLKKCIFVKAVEVTMQMCLHWLVFDFQAANIVYHVTVR